MVPAPELVEVAQIWWDVERVPVVVWDPAGTDFHLVDPDDASARLLLARFDEGVADPHEVAEALAGGLAACDFPPNGDGVAPERARRTLQAAGIDPLPADGRARSS
jgi:hypothetical protein